MSVPIVYPYPTTRNAIQKQQKTKQSQSELAGRQEQEQNQITVCSKNKCLKRIAASQAPSSSHE